MIFIKRPEEIEKMREAGKLLANVHKELKKLVAPGVSTLELDQFVDEYLQKHGATPEQKGYKGYKYATCASLNDEICHGFPSKKKLVDGDLLKIDMVVNLDGWLADSAWSYAVGEVSDEVKDLMKATKEALYLGIDQARVGNRLGDIGHAIQSHVEALGYSVVRDFVGHGIGKNIHEEPQVLHYGTPGRGTRISEGMVFTIEPMINAGNYQLKIDSNGWTARTVDGSLSCQYEHTIAITKDGPDILTEQDGR
ncbi:MAG: type I methionyl aminopeptidase [Tissierellia bacterium]|nr:type I methionyl aminopeptidase [Tissierellia bacterium]